MFLFFTKISASKLGVRLIYGCGLYTDDFNQENDKEIKSYGVPENPMTLDVPYMSTSTPKPGTKHQQLRVKFQDKEEACKKRIAC